MLRFVPQPNLLTINLGWVERQRNTTLSNILLRNPTNPPFFDPNNLFWEEYIIGYWVALCLTQPTFYSLPIFS